MPPVLAQTRDKKRTFNVSQLELRADAELPPGICGRIQGTAITYDTVDTYDTMFAPGCMSRSISERVINRKVNLFIDHEKMVRCHVGIVASMQDVGNRSVVVCDLLDTADGRSALEYCKAVIAAGGETGFSVGFIPRRGQMQRDQSNIATGVYRFTEIELRELSITPVPAVDGAQITGARREDGSAGFEDDEPDELMVTALHGIVATLAEERLDAALLELGYQRNAANNPEIKDRSAQAKGDEPSADASRAADEGKRMSTLEERINAVRLSFATT